jgi:hypothetical protein
MSHQYNEMCGKKFFNEESEDFFYSIKANEITEKKST